MSTTPVHANDSTEDFCKAIEGVAYDVHHHALGVWDVATNEWVEDDGVPYCFVLPFRTEHCPPGCEDHHRLADGEWIHRSQTLDAITRLAPGEQYVDRHGVIWVGPDGDGWIDR